MTLKLRFEYGSIIVEPDSGERRFEIPNLLWDQRTLQWRAPACQYRALKTHLTRSGEPCDDLVRNYEHLDFPSLKSTLTPRWYQEEALAAWTVNGCSGVISLPTGAGKTILAIMAIQKVKRGTLIVVPTLDLLQQWCDVLEKFLPLKVGRLGGGCRDVAPVTVATYDSAALLVEGIGNRFGFLVADECHHLPAPQYQLIGYGTIAPYRLGLSATVERADGKERLIYSLLGPLVYEAQISTLVEDTLAPYDVISINVPLTKDERERYTAARAAYVGFLRNEQINMASPSGWIQFVTAASRTESGRYAMQAYLEQRRIAQSASNKLRTVWDILERHKGESTIIFTNDNALAYSIGRQLTLPVLTHQTKMQERKEFLQAFREKRLTTLVTSKVLNEGVDVPEASVAIVVSGGSSVREHVQRLGRILRQKPGKRAVLYELVAESTNEQYVNQRRKQHDAYQRSSRSPGGQGTHKATVH